MIVRPRNVSVVTLVLVLAAACGSDVGPASTTSSTSATSTPHAEQAAGFPIATFAAISEDPVTEELGDKLQAGLEAFAGSDDFAEGGG